MRKAVLFDMDGVLIDSAGAHYRAWREVAGRLGADLDFDAFKPTMGADNADTIRTLFGTRFSDGEIDAIADAKEAAFRAAVMADFRPVAGAVDLVRALREADWGMALATSAPPENVDCVMNLLPGGECITVRVDRSMAARAKPEPDIFLRACELLGREPRDCLVIEDSLAGLEAARRAGMARLGLATSMAREALAPLADAVRDDLSGVTPAELLEIFAETETRLVNPPACGPTRGRV